LSRNTIVLLFSYNITSRDNQGKGSNIYFQITKPKALVVRTHRPNELRNKTTLHFLLKEKEEELK